MKKLITIALISLSVQLGLLVPALAMAEDSDASDTAQTVCISRAVDVRETAVTGAYADFASSTLIAYKARQADLKAAYATTTTSNLVIRSAVKKAWLEYNNAMKDARDDWRKARNDSWKAYRTSSAQCKADPLILDSANSAMEAAGL